jgi:3D (Asp-Asp-Asp) domain-containing protein
MNGFKTRLFLVAWLIGWTILCLLFLTQQGKSVTIPEKKVYVVQAKEQKAKIGKSVPKKIVQKPAVKKNYGKYRKFYPSRSMPEYRARKVIKTMKVEATAYCYGTKTASGSRVKNWNTVASDWGVLPKGSTFWITELGQDVMFRVEDVGSAVKENIIDIYNSSHSWCVNWGRKDVEINITKWGSNK